MNNLFLEFENENALRTYPFASGCTTADTDGTPIGTGIFIDAVLYPVNPTGVLYLSGVFPGGKVQISDDTAVIMESTLEKGSSKLEFYDISDLGRHCGTLLAISAESLATFANVSEKREFKRKNTKFAASCIFPIVNDGILSIKVENCSVKTGKVTFSNRNTDPIRVSTDQNGKKLRFDVIPQLKIEEIDSIRHIFCVVDGKTPFRIQKVPFGMVPDGVGNTIAVFLDNIERSAVCSNAHRENTLEMTDTCKECESDSDCHKNPEEPVEIPYFYQAEAVDMDNGADNAFYLTVPNITGYDNPLSITLKDGGIVAKTELDVGVDKDNTKELTDTISSNGVVLQVPGLAVTI